MKKYLVSFALVLGLVASAGVFAQSTAPVASPSFDNVSVLAQSPDFTSSAPVGYNVSFEKTVGETLFVLGGVNGDSHANRSNTNFDVGIGARLPLADNFAAFGDVYALHQTLENTRDQHSYGYGAEAGVRYQLNTLELLGGVASERAVANAGYTTYGKVGAQLSITQHVALVASYKYHDQSDKDWGLGVAYNF
jgi:hypothetical protein